MKISLFSGSIEKCDADLVVVPVRKGAVNPAFERLDRAFRGALAKAAARERFKPGKGKMFVWHGSAKGAHGLVMAIGLGTPEPDAAEWRTAVARAIGIAVRHHLRSVAVFTDATFERRELEARWSAEALALASYRFSRYRTKASKETLPGVGKVGVFPAAPDPAGLRRALEHGLMAAAGVVLARDLTNEPANVLSPETLAARAAELAQKKGLACRVLDPAAIRESKMGLITAVAAGSDREPRLVHLIYRPTGKARRKVALVGKGITFDSGGICIKPAKSMDEMKTDMAGAALVLGVMSVLPDLAPDLEVHGILPIAENAVGGSATRPGDVVKSMEGLMVEIVNTDAEGRLILADAIAYARKEKPDVLVDLATLTGACMVALGPFTAGVFSNDEALAGAFLAAAARAGESAWRMPLLESLEKDVRSDVADIKNTGGKWGGAIAGALFLKAFVGKTPWLHVDIAGPARADSATPLCPKGATGYGVLTCLELLARM
ncbi:MAG: leucyl aminopeptidase [Deltaproteobacteria bacterium]|nr:leucyl aminopeptidase [Deltaproteobacteria bacterium]